MMKQLKLTVLAAIAGVLAGAWAPASAHHSAAMFDMTKTVTVVGTVKEWQFMNPHSWLQVMTIGADGKEIQWSFEAAAPAGGGNAPSSVLHRDTFKPGDKVTVQCAPMKDGRHAGMLGEVSFADGHKWVPHKPMPLPSAPAPQ